MLRPPVSQGHVIGQGSHGKLHNLDRFFKENPDARKALNATERGLLMHRLNKKYGRIQGDLSVDQISREVEMLHKVRGDKFTENDVTATNHLIRGYATKEEIDEAND